VRTREFRVDEFGAPRYPELVVAVTRKTLDERRGLVDALVEALADGTEEALRDRGAAVREIAAESGADEGLVRAQLEAVAPALRPPLELDMAQLRRWASFDERFGILRRAPDVDRAFSRPD
jgi:NitT/TauT family transport system substrate-binding protein/putative hydroxymethylpyrimidine transport system substrate-binding protein